MYIFSADNSAPVAELLSHSPVTLGSLVSNRLIVSDPNADAIHCMIEKTESGSYRLTDLNSKSGVWLNGHRVDVEADVKDGDIVSIGAESFRISLNAPRLQSTKDDVAKNGKLLPLKKRHPLFHHVSTVPRQEDPRPADRRLEVVAYWGNTVLNVDHFHPDIKGYSDVIIGDPIKSHFVSGDRSPFASWVLAKAVDDSYLLKLKDGMRAQVRARGITTKHQNKTEILLTEKDYAHVRHGVVDYFIRYVTPPNVSLPVKKIENKLMLATGILGALAYLVLVTLALVIDPKPLATPLEPSPYWEIQSVDETREIKREEKIVTISEIKKQLLDIKHEKKPPVKATPPIEPEKLHKQPPKIVTTNPKIVEKNLSTVGTAPVTMVKNLAPGNASSAGASAKQNFKIAEISGLKGGPGQTEKTMSAGAMKGNQATSKPGVEGQSGKQASFVDLKNLSGNLGPVLAKNAPGGINVNFRSTGGGGGQKQGSAAKDYNLGGTGTNGNLAIPGSGGRIGDWGKNPSGSPIGGGIVGSLRIPGQNHISASPSVKPQDPLTGPVSLTQEEINAVIRQNLNQIRHCYEQTLQRSPNAEGRIKVRFVIGGGGRVSTQQIIENSVGDVKLDGCILGKISRWQFPTPRAGSVNVSYPFDFFRAL